LRPPGCRPGCSSWGIPDSCVETAQSRLSRVVNPELVMNPASGCLSQSVKECVALTRAARGPRGSSGGGTPASLPTCQPASPPVSASARYGGAVRTIVRGLRHAAYGAARVTCHVHCARIIVRGAHHGAQGLPRAQLRIIGTTRELSNARTTRALSDARTIRPPSNARTTRAQWYALECAAKMTTARQNFDGVS
jgi:hypothetical protein